MAPPMKPSREDMLAVTMNQKLAKQGAKTRKLAESRDVNTLPDPKTYAAVMGLLGERPDEMGFSVAHPKYKEIMDVADPAFALGTAAQVVPLVKPAGQAVRGAAKALAPKAGQMVMDAAQATGMPVYGLGVVKPKGGNWLAETDDRIKRMTPYPDLSKSIAVSKARIASAENAGANPRSIEMMKGDLAALERDQAVNNWTTRNLGNYIKKEMGTPDDPVRKLAEEGIVHAPHGDYIDVDSGTALPAKRSGLGFPAEGMGKSPEAKAWEELSDFAIKDTQAKNIQGADEGHRMYEAARARADAVHADIDQKFDEMVKSSMSPEEAAKMMRLPFKNKAQTLGREGEYEAALGEATKMFQSANAGKVDVLEANPWVSKLDPEERLYSGYFGDLGFDHIIDVLREDVRAGRIRPEQLSKVSMEQAVRRTYEYDLEMAKKMGQAGLTSMEGFPVHKQYPGGYKWIELRKPENRPEGWETSSVEGMWTDPSGRLVPDPNIARLEEALKYEGDTMGHCVGGYCPDVVSGRSRIYSLRDEKGMPHVTIEVEPQSRIGFREGEGPKTAEERFDLQTEWLKGVESGKIGNDVTFAEWWRSQNGIPEPERPLQISQIKGKQNKAPIEDYLPYVQDFVRSGNWSKVGDFHNTGLIRKSDLIDKFTPDQLDAIGKGEYLTKGEYDDLILKALRPPEEGMKAGGEVKMKEGGIKETPVKNKAAHGMSKALGAVHKFASEPFGYKNPPGEIVSEMLGIPATARTLERMGYGEPLTTGKGMTAKPRADTMDALMAVAPLAPITKGMPVGAVIKPKGGNWLTGSVEKALDPMIAKGMINNREIPYGPDFDIAIRKRIEDLRQQASQPGYQGGAGRAVEHLERELQNPRTNEAALNNWISRNLTNYVKKEMATPEDPVRKLAEQGIVHKQFHEIADPNSVLMQKRMGVGMPAKPMAQTEAGQFWENLADRAVDAYPAGSYKHGALDETLLERNPWLAKTPDETMIYSGKGLSRDLGFGHVVDVLREDLATGRIRPEQLNKVSMEQAVRRTYEYDQELAKKMEQARAAAREGLPVHKEYPEGFRWVELNKPGAFATESEAMGHSVRGYEPPKGHADWTEGSGDAGSLGYGHGGWEAIKSGKAKVYSLVDPKGNPHVTVEVKKNERHPTYKDIPEDVIDRLTEEGRAIGNKRSDELGHSLYGEDRDVEVRSAIAKAKDDWLWNNPITSESITQVKGKQNAAPKEEYLPFVQDFVRSSGMSVERDLQNTGLRDMERYEPLRKYLEGKGTKFERYIPEEEFKRHEDDFLMDRLYPPDDPRYPPLSDGMKAGGEVKMDKGGDAKKKTIDEFWRGMKESVPQRSELGPLDMLKQNLAAVYEGAQKVPGNLYKLATDPVGYAKSLPAPTGDQIINAFGPADMGFVGSYRPSTPLKPDPTVGTRYKVTDQGGLVPRQNLDIEQLQGSQAKIFPWDATSRNKLVTEVSEVPLKKPVLTEGGDEYMMDVQHVKNRIAGASNEGIANRILDRIDQASWENRQLGGTGKVYGFPVRMGEGAEFFSTFPADIVMDFIGQGALNKKELAALTKDLRTMNFLGKKAPLAGAAPVGTPEFEMQLREGVKKGKNTPAVTPGNLRKGLMNRLGMVEYQERMGYNLPDLQGAVIAENLKGVPKGYVGNVVAELDPGAKLRPSKSSSYSHDFSGQYAGSMPNQPVEFLMPNTYEVIYREMKKEYPDASQTALRNMTIGAMEKRKESISELIGQRSIDAVKTYQEGLRKGEFDPNNIQQVYDYMRRKKLELKLKKGGPVETKSGLLKVKRKK